MFVDSVSIELKAGSGGNGIVAFRREAMVEEGGPFGGSGGRGADIILEVDEGLHTLLDFSYNRKYQAEDGWKGQTKAKTGRSSEALILKVPPGTVVYNADTNEFMTDLIHHGEQKRVARGGRGGRGNLALAKANKHSLEISENGEPGEEINLRLELKLLADVGLVGLPSVGKSTLISVISKVKPKIAAYHFTTLVPNLGVAQTNDQRSFVVADLPGLIEGAAQGKGLGHQFLKHIERTRLILHVVDMGSFEYRDPIEDYRIINKELEDYGLGLAERRQLVVANKMDLPNGKENLEKFKKEFPNAEIIEISALTKDGLDILKSRTADILDEIGKVVFVSDRPTKRIYRFDPEQGIKIKRDEDGVLQVYGREIERLVAMTNFMTYDNTRRFANQLKLMGVYDRLEEAGVEPGEIVNVLDLEFEYEQ